jgi:hypothetical protein
VNVSRHNETRNAEPNSGRGDHIFNISLTPVAWCAPAESRRSAWRTTPRRAKPAHESKTPWPERHEFLSDQGWISESPTELDAKNAKCESDPVTGTAKKLPEEFEALTDQDRAELVAELLRRTALAPHDLPQDDDLAASADRLFVELDRQEQS